MQGPLSTANPILAGSWTSLLRNANSYFNAWRMACSLLSHLSPNCVRPGQRQSLPNTSAKLFRGMKSKHL